MSRARTIPLAPDVQQLVEDCRPMTALIPRDPAPLKQLDPYTVRMKEVAPKLINAENSIKGMRARIVLLEHKVAKLEKFFGEHFCYIDPPFKRQRQRP